MFIPLTIHPRNILGMVAFNLAILKKLLYTISNVKEGEKLL